MTVEGLIFLIAPLAALVAAGVIAAEGARRQVWTSAASLVLVSTVVWLVYVGLYQHETPCAGRTTGCPTVYGYDAPLPDEHLAGIVVLVAGFALPAAWVGWRRRVPPVTAGAALALGPTVLAWWTAPRGDNDGLWLLIFWLLPALGALAVAVAAVAEHIGVSRRRSRWPRDADRGDCENAESARPGSTVRRDGYRPGADVSTRPHRRGTEASAGDSTAP